jgi:hypothetical protein
MTIPGLLLSAWLLLPLPSQGSAPLSRIDTLALATFAQDAGEFGRARELYERALLLGPPTSTHLFRLARCCAAGADPAAAASYLFAAAGAGLRTPELATDPAFAALHVHPLWSTLVARVEEAAREHERSLRLPELRRELLQRMEQDQLARERSEGLPMDPGCPEAAQGGARGGAHDDGHDDGHDDAHDDTGEPSPELEIVYLPADAEDPTCIGAELEKVDRDNTARMREIVAQHGWPTRSLVGEDGAQAAWLLVQHADAEPEFQRHCLALMRAAPAGEVGLDQLAYLADRVDVNAGQPQTYGTQFRFDGERMVPAPLREPEKVDERRAAMGLYSLTLYARHFEAEHAK